MAVLGPTGSGKTALSLTLADAFGGEIVNCDSIAMFREFEMGTAKPGATERARAPHHLFDFVEPTASVSAGEYARQAREVLREIESRGHLPIVAGGTGLYLRALLEGLFAGPPREEELRERLRQRVAQKPAGYLHRMLRRLDSAAAEKIHTNDTPKLIRAIEVCLLARRPMTEAWEQGRAPLQGFRIARIGLNPERKVLYDRINRRAREMWESGLAEETQRLLTKYGGAAWALNSLGYRQAAQFLRGEIDRAAAVAATQQAHRNYAKRQMTWFRREPDVHWLDGFGDDSQVQRQAVERIRAMVS